MIRHLSRFVALLLWIPVAAMAMQMKLSRPDICSVSHHVVVGKVTQLENRWAVGRDGSIERVVQVAVSDVILGPELTEIEVVLPGGHIGDQGHWVEDVPSLMVNGGYLLLLAPRMDDERAHVQGGEAGAVRLTPEGARVGETREQALASVEVCRAKE